MNRLIVACAVAHASGAWKTLMRYVKSFTPLRTVIWPHLRGVKAREEQSHHAAAVSFALTFRAFCLMNFSTASYASSSTICFGGDFIR